MQLLVIDFETYYNDSGLGFRTQTTEEYVRDPRFGVVGVAVQVGDEEPQWFSGDRQAIREFLMQFDWGNAVAVAHNAMFDMAILNWHFGIKPKIIADTLSMARALNSGTASNSLAKLAVQYGLGVKGEEVVAAINKRRRDFTPEELDRYARYCCNDVLLTYNLFMLLLPQFQKTELQLIDATIRMFTEPVLQLDTPLLEQHLAEVRARKRALLDNCGASVDDLMSNLKFAQLLRRLGVEPPVKISPTTGKETLALSKNDEAFKALADHPDERVQALVAARLGNKSTLEETRTERLLGIARRGLIPVPLAYYAAHTGRWGGADKLNFQNLPSRGANANKLKRGVRAPEGHVIIDCDSSQIEARVLAWFAGQKDLVQFFEENNAEIAAGVKKQDMQYDPYKIMAAAIYGKAVGYVVDAERFVGKTTILGCGYGMGAVRFKAQLKVFNVDIEDKEAERIIRIYRETYPWIPALWQAGDDAIAAMAMERTTRWGNGAVVVGKGGLLLPNGLYQRYPNLRKAKDNAGKIQYIYDSRNGITKIYGGKLTENVCQGLARCIVGEQLLKIRKRYKVVLTVHDAVACIAPKDEAEEAMAYVMECMRYVPSWAEGVPLNCEAGYGDSYGDC